MPGSPDVEQHQIDVVVLHDLQRRLAGAGLEHAVVAPQDRRQRLARGFVDVDDEHGLAAFGHGSASIARS